MRENGYYWVMRGGNWIVCYWFSENNSFYMDGFSMPESAFEKIYTVRIKKPNEPTIIKTS